MMHPQELQRQQAATNGKADDFRLKLKECRATLSVKEKQLETAQRLLDRLGMEKQEMQVSRWHLRQVIALQPTLHEPCIHEAITRHTSGVWHHASAMCFSRYTAM